MEIEINEFEKHIITFPEKMTSQEFCILVDSRLIPLRKSMGRDDMIEMIKGNEKIGIKNKVRNRNKKDMNKEAIKKLRASRDLVVQLWKIYYSGDFEKYEKFIDENNLRDFLPKRNFVNSGTSRKIRIEFGITPRELGIKEYPTKKNPKIKFINKNGK